VLQPARRRAARAPLRQPDRAPRALHRVGCVLNGAAARILAAVAMGTLACGKPGVAPGLDQYTCDGGPCPAPGVIRGQVVYDGPAHGDAILLLVDTPAPPPPDGNGSGPLAAARVK